MANLSFLDSKATTLPQNNTSTIIKDKVIDEVKSIIPLAEAGSEAIDIYKDIKEDGFKKTEASDIQSTNKESNLSFLDNKADDVNVTDFERIQYGFAKETWILGNLWRMGSAKTKDWLDNNSVNDKTYKEHIQENTLREKKELDEEYWKFADGKYDDDSLVKISEFVTMVADPMYLYLYGTPMGRRAMKSYGKFAVFTGVTAGLDKVIRDLATEGEIKPGETAAVASAAAVLGPLGKYGLEKLAKLFPRASETTLKKVSQVVENRTKQKFGNISDKELNNIRKVLADRKVISANKLIETELNFMSKFKGVTDKFVNEEKALLKEYSRIIDSKSIAKKIKDLTKKKELIKAEQLKKRTYPESGFNVKNRLIDTRLKITNLEKTFAKQKADYLLKSQQQFEKVSKRIGERNNLIIEKLEALESPITRLVLRPLLSVSTLPLGGMVAGATLDAIWGDEAGIAEGALWGLAAGSTVKAIGASKVLSLDNKKKYLGFIWGDAQKLWFQKAREMTAGTLATKLESFGGNTKAFGFQLLENIDNPMAAQSVVRKAYVLKKNWERTNRELVKGYSLAEQAGAIKILRGSDDKFLTGNKRVLELADKTKLQINKFNDLLKNAGIYKELLGIEFGSKGILKAGTKVNEKSQMALRRKQFSKDIESYFPREYNREVIAKNLSQFRETIENIMKGTGVKNYVQAAANFIESTRIPGSVKMIDEAAIKSYITNLSSASEKNFLKQQWFKTPITEHISKERMLNGPYKKVEKLLEEGNFLNNNIEEVLNNLGARTFKSVAFVERFGPNGNFIQPLLKGIKDKYKNAALKPGSNIKESWGNWANTEAKVIVDSIDAYFGRYGSRVDKGSNIALGMLSTGSNLAMLNNVFFASLGDFMQGFVNSRNTAEWFKAFARTGFTAKREKGTARWLNLHFDDEIQKANLKPLVIADDISLTNVSDWLGSGKTAGAFNNAGFAVMGMTWLTGAARRFAYNVGTGDAYSSSRQLYKMVAIGNKNINSKEALVIQNHLQKMNISVDEALKIGRFKNYKTAIKDKESIKALNKAGLNTSNRDAIIPQVSNRLLFSQSRNPYFRILGQFMSWAQAKTSQTNKIVQRIENGDVKAYIKLLMAIPVYSSIQQIRELTKYGEVRTEWGQRWEDHIQYLAEGFKLSGNMGWLPETVASRAVGPGKRKNPLLWFPAATYLDDLKNFGVNLYEGKIDSSLRYADKLLPLPIYRRWMGNFWNDVIMEKGYNSKGNKKQINRFDKKIKKMFVLGGEVTADNTANVVLNNKELTEGVNEAKKDTANVEEKQLILPKKKPMKKKDLAAAVVATTLATTGVTADMDKAIANDIIPAKKPNVVVKKTYDNLPDLPLVKKEWLNNTAEKVYLTNNNNVIPNDIILSINGGETGWGTSRFWKEGSKNLFNIQSFDDKEKSIPALDSDAKIKVFKTEEDSIKEFLNWIETKDSYAGVREEIKLYNKGESSKNNIIDAIAKTGFAEDDDWADKIKSILKKRINGKHKKELQKLATTLFTNPGNKN